MGSKELGSAPPGSVKVATDKLEAMHSLALTLTPARLFTGGSVTVAVLVVMASGAVSWWMVVVMV